jgi:hypothetical protein
MGDDVPSERFVFIGGLHRSGTTLLYQCVTDHPEINRFRKTDVPEDEGEFLQTVYPDHYNYGGPGQFGFVEAAHLTERSPLASPENARLMLQDWSGYWAKDASIYAEKTPRNIINSRFLQQLFPSSCFVFMVRHPLAVAMATRKWSISSISNLVLHWLACHEILLRDIEHLNKCIVVRYEDFITKPREVVGEIHRLAGVSPMPVERKVRADGNRTYEAEWAELQHWADAKGYSFADRYRAGSRSDWRQRGAMRRFNNLLDRLGWSNQVQTYMPYGEVSAVTGYLRPQLQRFGYDVEDGRFSILDQAVLPYCRFE